MPKHPYRIQTRQKTDVLAETLAPLGASDSIVFNPRRVAGYGAIMVLAIADQAFSVIVEEANDAKKGPWAVTETFASALDAVSGFHVVCQTFTPCGTFARFSITNGAATQGSLSAKILGLPIAGGGGTGGGGGGPSSIVQLRDGSASPTLASVKVDGTLIGTQGSVLVGGETPTGTQEAIQLNAAGDVIVAPLPNQPTFACNQKTVPTPGTAVQVQSQVVPDEFTIFYRALTDNEGKIWCGPDKATAEDHTKATPLDAGDYLILALKNTDELWVDAEIADEGLSWTVETP